MANVAATPSIHLTENPGPKDCLHCAYHLTSQMVGLYSLAAELDHHRYAKDNWLELSDSMLRDIGVVFGVWETQLQLADAVVWQGKALRIGHGLAALAQRVSTLVRLFGVWTPILRWIRIMLLVERRWTLFLERFQEQTPPLRGSLAEVVTRSRDRQSRLTGLQEAYLKENERMAIQLGKATNTNGQF